MADTLLNQLSWRVASFIEATGITHKQLARIVGCERSQLTSYLSTGRGLSAERALRLMNVLNSSRAQLERKFSKPNTATIVHFQQGGKLMKLDSSGSWVSGQSGQDPNGSDDVTGVKTARDLDNADDYLAQTIAMLRDQQQILRQADAHIEAYITNAQKAHPNANGSTGPARQISRPKTAGPRGDLLP